MRTKAMNAARRAAHLASRGFTLIELMVVILILGLLIGLVGPRVWHILASGSQDVAKMQMKNLADAIEMYYIDNRTLPNTLEDLVQPSKKTNEPYIDAVPQDPWNMPYDYRVVNAARKEFTITSGGEDKQIGSGDDDLTYPEKK